MNRSLSDAIADHPKPKSAPKESPGSVALGCLGVLILLPISALTHAWSALTLYRWFAEPLGAPHVGLLSMWGLTMLVSTVRPSGFVANMKDKSIARVVGESVGSTIAPLIGVAVAWAVLEMWGPP